LLLNVLQAAKQWRAPFFRGHGKQTQTQPIEQLRFKAFNVDPTLNPQLHSPAVIYLNLTRDEVGAGVWLKQSLGDPGIEPALPQDGMPLDNTWHRE
jgi:hypothetical protein